MKTNLEIAKAVVRDLNNLENKCSAIDKISHGYPGAQISIVMKHIRHLTSAIHADGDKLCDCEEPNLHPSHPDFCSDCNRRR